MSKSEADLWVCPQFTAIEPGKKPDFPVPAGEFPTLNEGAVIVNASMVFKVAKVKEEGGLVMLQFCGMTPSWIKGMRAKYGTAAKRQECMKRNHQGGGNGR